VIARQLTGLGCDVILLTEASLKRVVNEVLEESEKDRKKIIVVEDGGYVVPYVHKIMPDTCQSYILGAVEQTRNGINKVKETISQLRFPLLSVAEARLKRQYESPMVAAAVLQNILRLRPNEYFQGQAALVIGYGSVGYHIANELKISLPWKMKTKVYDRDVELRKKAKEDGHIVDDNIQSLIPDTRLVIGITGRTSIGRDEILLLRHRCVLLSASSDQVEIDLRALRDLSGGPESLEEPGIGKVGDIYRLTSNKNEILLLAEGYPINFWKTESLPNKVSQIVLTPIFLSTLALVKRTNEIPIGYPEKDFVDKLLEQEELEKLFLEMSN
jgi:S-adenosylhomocysteine hydrolase